MNCDWAYNGVAIWIGISGEHYVPVIYDNVDQTAAAAATASASTPRHLYCEVDVCSVSVVLCLRSMLTLRRRSNVDLLFERGASLAPYGASVDVSLRPRQVKLLSKSS